MSRRHFVSALGAGAGVALTGCINSGDPTYEDGQVDDADGEERTAEEATAAEAQADQEARDDLTSLDTLALRDHEFVMEDGFAGATVQGTVENTGEDRVEAVEVRVRVYDDEGNQLGRYLDSTGDFDGETTWSFQVILLESPEDIARYDIAVLGLPS